MAKTSAIQRNLKRIKLSKRFLKKREALKKIIQFSDNHPDIEIIYKLHPQQNVNNEIIKDMIKNKKQIKVLQSGTVKHLLTECDLVINIATDNFDASSLLFLI